MSRLPVEDAEIASLARKRFEKRGISILTDAKVSKVDKSKVGITAHVELKNGDKKEIKADVLISAVGVQANSENLGLEKAGVKIDRGVIVVDGHGRTNVDGIWAIGDVAGPPMLAHKAEDEGVAVAELLAGQSGHVNYGVIPNVVYTYPEVASVGKTEEELKKDGITYNSGKFPFTANGRAKVNHTTAGDRKSDA